MLRFFKHTFILLALVWAVTALGAGEKFDEACVIGRVSADQAVALNTTPWGHCPHNDGCEAAESDRVFSRKCSELLKFTWKPEKWIKAFRTGEPPW